MDHTNKGGLTKIWELFNVIRWRLYEQFSRNYSAMAPEKISNFQNIKMLYIAFKHVIWRFRICNYFCEISKFRDFMNTLRNFAKSVLAHISVEFKYFANQFTLTESLDHAL